MKKINILIILTILISGTAFTQNNSFKRFDFLIGSWVGTGSGFGNEESQIESEFSYIMNGKYLEVVNDSKFSPTENNLEGEHHIDKGIISFDKIRELFVYRQFNIEGYVNQYVLVDSLSNEFILVFETEFIENFMPGGKARWVIRKMENDEIETTFDVSFPGKEYSCFGRNLLKRKE